MSATTAYVSRAAIAANVATLDATVGDAMVCAVVKADGYGHGAVRAAEAALDGGAAWLAVASVAEARVLRGAGVDAPLLVLSEPDLDTSQIEQALTMGLRLVVFREATVRAVDAVAIALGVPEVPLHLKADTGMRRVGCEPDEAVALAKVITAAERTRLEGTMTHLAVADEPGLPTTDAQLDAFDRILTDLADAGIEPGIRHAANSAGAIAHPRSRYDMVRTGISIYGIPPAPELAGSIDLVPALRWTAPVRHVKRVRAGEKVSYGHRYTFDRATTVATVAAGYADGVRRALGLRGGRVLLGGEPRPIVGVVTMDQLMVDCGPDAQVQVGDEAVLLGRQTRSEITADDIAGLVDTISYEIVCGLSSRVPRIDADPPTGETE